MPRSLGSRSNPAGPEQVASFKELGAHCYSSVPKRRRKQEAGRERGLVSRPMPGVVAAPRPRAVMELPVEPQSLKKLSFKSLKRALDLFSPIHGYHSPSDPESKRIRISYKVGDSLFSVSVNPTMLDYFCFSLLFGHHYDYSAGSQEAKASQNDGNQNAIVPAPTMLPKGPYVHYLLFSHLCIAFTFCGYFSD
ncbi:hypothetical protein BHM03_00019722 [Ensete ventricosum]|nr:hypothetical protein BHM03_00019722 [Ensete ventricosum]